MTHRHKWWVIAPLLLVCAAAILSIATRFREPKYEERPLSAWLADLSSSNYQTQNLARAALRAIGPAAVPYLTNSLAQRNAVSVRIFRKGIVSARLLNWTRGMVHWQSPLVESHTAALALKTLGPQGTNAIAALIDATAFDSSYTIAMSAALALGAMGSNAAPAYADCLSHATGRQLNVLLQAAYSFGTNAGPLIPHLTRMLEAEDKSVVAGASLALQMIGDAAIPAVVERLSSTNPVVKTRALIVLYHAGVRAAVATNTIARLARSDDREVRLAAMRALAATMPEREYAETIWIEGLRDPDLGIVNLSVQQLVMFPATVRAHSNELASIAQRTNEPMRSAASNALTVFHAWPR